MSLNARLTDWQGRRAWIVGASTGIGEAVARALHGQGAHVHVSARDAGRLQAMSAAHPGMLVHALDATSVEQVRAAAAQVLQHGVPDLVLYCAGYYKPTSAQNFQLDEMLRHQQVNYVGALHVIDAVLPALLAHKRGHISLVSSVAGFRGLPRSLGYGPTKAALINLGQSLYLDLQPLGLSVSVVNPGFVATPLTAQNEFKMPALVTPDEAARQMLRGWARGEFEIHFPKRFTRVMKMLSLLPFGAYQAIVRKATAV